MRSTSTQSSNSAKRKGASHQKAGVEALLQGAFFPEPDVTDRMREDAILAQAKEILAKRIRREILFETTSPAAVRDHLTLNMAEQEFESFRVLFLDAQHRLIADDVMFVGTLTQTSVYPREIVKRALRHNAAAVILSHNHPSGVAEPSRADEALTRTLQSALALVDVRILDHIIVAGTSTLSFAERGLL